MTLLHPIRRGAVLAGAAAALLLAPLALSPSRTAAAPIGADGLIHACYKAKGKGKGAVRLVRAGKPCKRMKREKAVAWSVDGATTTTNPVTREQFFALFRVVQEQATVIDQLEGTLGGVTGTLNVLEGDVVDLNGVLAGVTNGELTDVIDSLPVLDTVCSQLSLVTDQTNLLRGVIGGLGLNGILTGLGGLLNIPTLPAALAPFSCPAG